MSPPEAYAQVGISTILEKVVEIEKHLAVMACDLGALRKTTTEELGDLDTRVDALEGDRWPWLKIGALVAVGTLVLSITLGILTQWPDTPGARPPPPPTTPR